MGVYNRGMAKHLDALLGLWTTKEVARKMGASAVEVSRWRTGLRRPNPSRVRKIADALAALRVEPLLPTPDDVFAAQRDVAVAVAADAAERRQQSASLSSKGTP